MIEFLLMVAAFVYGALLSVKYLLLFPLAMVIYCIRYYCYTHIINTNKH